MQDTLFEEKKKDEEIYEKMSCWCEVNDKEKTASIAAAEGAIEGLEAEMEKAKEAIETATAMREEEKAEFTA